MVWRAATLMLLLSGVAAKAEFLCVSNSAEALPNTQSAWRVDADRNRIFLAGKMLGKDIQGEMYTGSIIRKPFGGYQFETWINYADGKETIKGRFYIEDITKIQTKFIYFTAWFDESYSKSNLNSIYHSGTCKKIGR